MSKEDFDEAVGTGPFTDEFRDTLFCPDGRRRINRREESFGDTRVIERDRLWGCSAVV